MSDHKHSYFASIDGLRFFAAINVALFHYVSTEMDGLKQMGGNPSWLFHMINGPMFHASLFFILGGFIFGTKITPHVDRFSTKIFLKRRLLQLYPLHVIATLFMAYIIGTSDHAPSAGKMILSIFVHLTFLFPFMPGLVENLNTPSWALAVFFFAYLFLKPLISTIRHLKSPAMIISMMIFTWIMIAQWCGLYALVKTPTDTSHYFFFHVFPLARLLEVMLGLLLARLFQVLEIHPGIAGWKTSRKLLMDFIFIVTIAFLYLSTPELHTNSTGAGFFISQAFQPLLFTILITLMAIQQGIIAKVMAFPVIRWLGRGSFYPYLLHIPVAIIGYRIYVHFTGDASFFIYPWAIASLLGFLFLFGGTMNAIQSRRRVSSVKDHHKE